MVKKQSRNKARKHRHLRVRGKISGTAERPRLNVFRSLNHIYAQLIDDVAGVTLAPLPAWKKILASAAAIRKLPARSVKLSQNAPHKRELPK